MDNDVRILLVMMVLTCLALGASVAAHYHMVVDAPLCAPAAGGGR
jgi:hypothetical protein